MTAWFVILAVGLGTYAFRAVMFAVIGGRGMPEWADRPLAFVGPAALGALIGTMLLTRGGHPAVPGVAEATAAVCAFATVRLTGNVAHGIAAGFPILWALVWLGL